MHAELYSNYNPKAEGPAAKVYMVLVLHLQHALGLPLERVMMMILVLLVLYALQFYGV